MTTRTHPYPIALDLRSRKCLIAGGGAVALRKAQGLADAGAVVTVAAPEVCKGLDQLESEKKVLIVRRPFLPSDVEGALLVFAATDSVEVNEGVAKAARNAGILVNRVDDAEQGDFAGMSCVVRDSLLIGISTGSDSPAFSRWIREKVEALFGTEYGDFLALLAVLREEVKRLIPAADRSGAWDRALKSGAFDLLRSGKKDEAVSILRSELGLDAR